MKYLPRILLADDEADYLTLLTSLLRANDFDVYSLSNPDHIFNLARVFKPDIILLDVRLGNYDGKEICRQLKADDDSKSIKIILHSAVPGIADEYHLCGADEFIMKPTEMSYLLARLRIHLQQE
jgi:DNA-binding response OmpR family regulator